MGNATRRPERQSREPHYMIFCETWRSGELEPLEFPHTRAELRNPSATLTLEPR